MSGLFEELPPSWSKSYWCTVLGPFALVLKRWKFEKNLLGFKLSYTWDYITKILFVLFINILMSVSLNINEQLFITTKMWVLKISKSQWTKFWSLQSNLKFKCLSRVYDWSIIYKKLKIYLLLAMILFLLIEL